MSDSSKFVAESLEELLAGIANGVREAQAALNNTLPMDEYGRPLPTYHLPYIDFDLKVQIETEESDSGKRSLRIKSLFGGNTTNENSQINSSITGRISALPPGEGLPVPLLQMTTTRLSARRHRIDIQAVNSAGELLQNATVELNLDVAMSQALSTSEGVNLPSLRSSSIGEVLLVTDTNGQASTELGIDNGLPSKALVVINAELDRFSTSVVVTAGNE